MDGAKWAVPDVISDIEKDPYLPRGSNGSVAVAVSKLVFRLAGEGHSRDAAAWSIYGLIASGRLGAELVSVAEIRKAAVWAYGRGWSWQK